jgi:hypothetical protein
MGRGPPTSSGSISTGVRSVTYYVRDASSHWHRIGPITHRPFEAQLNWWEWDNAGQEMVTSHVVVQGDGWFGLGDGETDDPGGWHSVDGAVASPGGAASVTTNSDGLLGARYEPDRHVSQIQAVQFWLRVGGTWSKVGESARPADDRFFDVPALDGAIAGRTTASDTALSVHVIWQGGHEWIDPVPWVWQDRFGPAPTPAATPTSTPTPTATPVPATPTPTSPPVVSKPTARPVPPQPTPTRRCARRVSPRSATTGRTATLNTAAAPARITTACRCGPG